MAYLPNYHKPPYKIVTAENMRSERARRLLETDWMSNSDVTMGAAWKTYRQALRDFPDNATYDEDGVVNNWPVDPEDYYK